MNGTSNTSSSYAELYDAADVGLFKRYTKHPCNDTTVTSIKKYSLPS